MARTARKYSRRARLRLYDPVLVADGLPATPVVLVPDSTETDAWRRLPGAFAAFGCRIELYLDQGGASGRRWPGVSGGLCLGRPARRTPGHSEAASD